MIKLLIPARTFQSLRRFLARLEKFTVNMNDRSRAHRNIGTKISRRWRVNFDTEGSLYGSWTPLSQATIDLHGRPKRILNRTGALRSGFISQANAPAVKANATEWNFSRNPVYLFTHHFGMNPQRSSFALRRGFGPVPSRPLWDLNQDDEDIVVDELEKYVDRLIGQYF